MKLPKNYFENLSASKYREYLKLLPNMQEENTRIITTLIFTFAAMSFFGIFAINPTLSTIVELKKQLADSEQVNELLTTKINNLSALQGEYTLLTPDLPVILTAVPEDADAPLLMGQVQSLAKQSKLTLISFRISEVQLTAPKVPTVKGSSFIFSLEAQGEYQDMINFVSALSKMNRIVTLESLSITKEPKQNALVLNIRARQYFKKL